MHTCTHTDAHTHTRAHVFEYVSMTVSRRMQESEQSCLTTATKNLGGESIAGKKKPNIWWREQCTL
jgi:hypothetical protein